MDRARRVLQRSDTAAAWLTRSDHLRLARINDRAERARRAATYVALRMIIASLCGRKHARARMLRRLGRAPRLLGAPAVFNLSHSEHLALIGVARRGRIGVDMEVMRTVPMSARNRARIVETSGVISQGAALSADADRDVLQAWTRIESFSKATGRGINRTLADFGIRAQQNPRWHTPGGSVAEKARRQLPDFAVRDLRLPADAIAAVTRSLRRR
jgi:4'-phosphopantetheinyl transferase